ncbi:MAG TPA: hypothetical protein VK929_08540 [Longimicrobiales bacterium]|nr:hypothetical protein [Longimicrobiales bacterium]
MTTEFRGLYSAGFEEESFRPCDSRERWWVANPAELGRQYQELGAHPYEPVLAVILGDTSRAGPAGHLGLYQRYVRVHAVVRIERLDSLAAGVPPRCPAG